MATLKEAREQGLSRYYTGAPCKHGHVAERMTSNRRCVTCLLEDSAKWKHENKVKASETSKQWRHLNTDKVKEAKKVWNAAHKEEQKARSRKWYLQNREKANQQHYEWAARNKGTVLAAANRRRAREKKQMPVWADAKAILQVYKRAAKLRATGCDVHVDHIVPLAGVNVSGLHVHYNLQILAAKQNRTKSNNFLN